jgi:PAS domain S-box-containing protein
LNGLYHIAEVLNACKTEQEILTRAMDRLIEFPHIASAWVFLVDDESPPRYFASSFPPPELEAPGAMDGECRCLQRLAQGDLDAPAQIYECERFRRAGGDADASHLHASVPLRGGEQVLGILNVAGVAGEEIRDDDLKVLFSVGHQIGFALERVRLIDQLQLLLEQRSAALRETEAWFRGVFESQDDAVFVVSLDRIVMQANQSALEMLGYELGEIRGQSVSMMHIDEPQYARFCKRVDDAVRTGEAARFEFQLKRKNAECFPSDHTVSVLRGATGEVLGIVLVVRDISERIQNEKKIEEMQKQFYQAQRMESIGHLAGGIAHDMNNVLSSVIGFTEMALTEIAPDSQLFEDLALVKDAGERGARLVSQILAFGRRQVLEPVVIDLNPTITEFQRMMERIVGEDVEVRVILESDLKPVLVDETQFEQILLNLVVNARDAMPNGGVLAIETANTYLDEGYAANHYAVQAGEYVQVTVSDTGVGMDAGTRERIFEPFYTTKEFGSGTGLGLATVFGVVKQHGGHILVYSEPNRGSAFKVYFPVAEATEADLSRKETVFRAQGGTENILVVEDDNSVRGLVEAILTRNGYHVILADGPNTAISIAADDTNLIDLVLTDVVMPGMNGQELVDLLRATRPTIKALFFSGYTQQTINHRGVLDQGVVYLPKPFTVATLLTKVREALSVH